MPDPSPTELNLTPELLDYGRRVAFKEAQKRCRPGVDHDDAAQQALLHLIAKPPTWDPARGATPKSLVYTVIQRAVMKFAVRERKTVRKFEPLRPASDAGHKATDGVYPDPSGTEIARNRTVGLSQSFWTKEDVLDFIDNETSRETCRVIMESGGNISEAARRLGRTEGAIRSRLNVLLPKLLATGFKVVSEGEFHERKHGQG
jgi:DNA-directed RNA polymerase specialized sigma24 family protein